MQPPGWAGLTTIILLFGALFALRETVWKEDPLCYCPAPSFTRADNVSMDLVASASRYKQYIGILQLRMEEKDKEIEDLKRAREDLQYLNELVTAKDKEMRECQGAAILVEKLTQQLADTKWSLDNMTAEADKFQELLGQVPVETVEQRAKLRVMKDGPRVKEMCEERGFVKDSAQRNESFFCASRGYYSEEKMAYKLHDCQQQCERSKLEAGLTSDTSAFVSPIPEPNDVEWSLDLARKVGVLDIATNSAKWRKKRLGIFPQNDGGGQTQYFESLVFKDSVPENSLPVPADLLAEVHHDYYGAPWALGRDIFEFMVHTTGLQPQHRVLDIGCGSMRVGIHFAAYLHSGHYDCVEADPLSVAAALLYELPLHGLLQKRPSVLQSKSFEVEKLDHVANGGKYDLIIASAVFIHLKPQDVWNALGKLSSLLVPESGRMFLSHNLKFCEDPKWSSQSGCEKALPCEPPPDCAGLKGVNLEYLQHHRSYSRMFNWEEYWFEFKYSTEGRTGFEGRQGGDTKGGR